jgi:hypothetical protein
MQARLHRQGLRGTGDIWSFENPQLPISSSPLNLRQRTRDAVEDAGGGLIFESGAYHLAEDEDASSVSVGPLSLPGPRQQRAALRAPSVGYGGSVYIEGFT